VLFIDSSLNLICFNGGNSTRSRKKSKGAHAALAG
jgi:hypothetical protein